MASMLERIKRVTPYEYKRIAYVSAEELVALTIAEFGEEQWTDAFPNGYRGGKLRSCPDSRIRAFLDAKGDELRAERQALPKWQRLHYGLVIDDLIDTFPDVISRNDAGEIDGYSLSSYVGILHGCIAELIGRIEALEAA